MATLFASADKWLRRLPDWALFAICMSLVAGVAVFKVTTGHDVPIADFILVPVAGMAWLARSPRYAYLAALLAASVTVVDEFAVLMPETAEFAAMAVARRLRDELLRVTLPDGNVVRFSIGVASFSKPPTSVDAMIHEADALMYRAKDQGKDRIESCVVGTAV